MAVKAVEVPQGDPMVPGGYQFWAALLIGIGVVRATSQIFRIPRYTVGGVLLLIGIFTLTATSWFAVLHKSEGAQ